LPRPLHLQESDESPDNIIVIVQEDMVGLQEYVNVAPSPKFTLGLGHIIFGVPIE
jgi:hypothetical protein